MNMQNLKHLSRVSFGCGLALGLVLMGTASDLREQHRKEKTMQVISLNDPVLDRWLNESICVPDESFVPLNGKDKLFFRPLQESKGSLGVFLKEEVDPFRGLTGTKWLVHAADPGGIDLLRSKYEAAKLHLAVTESINFVVVKAMPIGR